jgi:hypothetical protein
MSKELKVGDRVRVYSADHDRGIFTAKVIGPYGDVARALIEVETPEGRRRSYYRKQCRRLKPKAPKEKPEEPFLRRQKWMTVFRDSEHFLDSKEATRKWEAHANFVRTVHLVELRPGEKPLSRKDLAVAFAQAFTMPGNTHKVLDPDLFNAMAKIIGFTDEGVRK